MGYDAGDDHGQSKEGPQKHDDEGADGGEEKSVSGSIGSDGKQNRQSSAGWTQGVLYCLLNTAKDRPERRSFLHVMPYHCRFLNPRLKNLMCKSEFSVLF